MLLDATDYSKESGLATSHNPQFCLHSGTDKLDLVGALNDGLSSPKIAASRYIWLRNVLALAAACFCFRTLVNGLFTPDRPQSNVPISFLSVSLFHSSIHSWEQGHRSRSLIAIVVYEMHSIFEAELAVRAVNCLAIAYN